MLLLYGKSNILKDYQEIFYQIALTFIPKVGSKLGKTVVAHCGGAEGVFKESKKNLLKIDGVGEVIASSIIHQNQSYLKRAEQEIAFMEKQHIQTAFFLDDHYPERLKHCNDAPLLLYYKGNSPLQHQKVVAIVGTRNATVYGQQFCEDLLTDLSVYKDLLVVSGLAYGIDSYAHQASVNHHIPNIAVLGHGLDRIYPSTHYPLAENVQKNGCLLTEFPSGTIPDRENFPRRNRIIAGMSDAIIVVESAKKGGSIITAEIGNSYNRDVFAVPGRLKDRYSEGCNHLIKTNRAALIQSAKDLEYIMGWEQHPKKQGKQRKIFVDLTPEEEQIVNILEKEQQLAVDELILHTGLRASSLASALLNLEFEGIIRCLPGKVYMLL